MSKASQLVSKLLEAEQADPDVPPLAELESFAHDSECFLVAEEIAKTYPKLSYQDGFYRPKREGGGHAWVVTPSGTIIDATRSQFDPSTRVAVIFPSNPEHANYVPWQRMTRDEYRELYGDEKPISESDDGEDPDDYSLFDDEPEPPVDEVADLIDRHKLTMEYHDIVFMQGDDATEPLQILDERGEDAAMEYLAQWDYGGENEHSPSTSKPWGSSDHVVQTELGNGDIYYLTYNTRYGYIGLVRGRPKMTPTDQ